MNLSEGTILPADLTGLEFGRLRVVSQAGKVRGQTTWHCQCLCGNTSVVTRGNLKHGVSKSCGCQKKFPPQPAPIDLTGKVFSRLTVIEFATRDPRGQSYWHCLCACGVKKDIRGGNLTSGESRSCGCLAREMRASRRVTGLDRITSAAESGNIVCLEGPSAQSVRNQFTYDPETGLFRSNKTGKICGSRSKSGHRRISVNRKAYPVHRLAWLVSYGVWPQSHIDHINRDPSDNRLCNLRLANRAQNAANTSRKPFNTSGFKGVYFDKRSGGWVAQIHAPRKVYLGTFSTAERASDEYEKAALKRFGEFHLSERSRPDRRAYPAPSGCENITHKDYKSCC